MLIKVKPDVYVSLVEQPGPAVAPCVKWRPAKAEGKQSRSQKPGNALPHPARKKTQRAKTVSLPSGGGGGSVGSGQTSGSGQSAGTGIGTGKGSGIASGTGSGIGSGSGPGTGSGCGNATAGAMTEDFTFGDSSGPAFFQKAPVRYPLIARRMGRQGTVLLRLTIDERGKLLGVEVLKDPGCGFAESSVEAVKKSRFSPARRNGRPVPSRVTLPIRFVLEESE